MATLTLVDINDPILHKPVKKFDFESNPINLIRKMTKVMDDNRGVGIAANQVGVNAAICLVRHKSELLVLINPFIRGRWSSYTTIEQCLSIPKIPFTVRRYKTIDISFQDENGEFKELYLRDCEFSQKIQHEIDHLNGILISDYCDHLNCWCKFVKRRPEISIEHAMREKEIRRELGLGDLHLYSHHGYRPR